MCYNANIIGITTLVLNLHKFLLYIRYVLLHGNTSGGDLDIIVSCMFSTYDDNKI